MLTNYIEQLKNCEQLKEQISSLNIELDNQKLILENQIFADEEKMKKLIEEKNIINDDLINIQNSKSWKITKPLRVIMSNIQRKEW